ncbi:hypothetical protein [Rubellimicrobium sp. CFH 75288]|uniref:hypothetical protein n=1 Tax=Rubellimicrobium sp. CFH 75288 TaxID=2697034 RepID=UPI0014136628|nr:hypothetical protein [Rubellimicrobium sp. CFH 75288]NAZ36009.1 hypothetical protein [Rubellimicrobium sp. CFH 75288]
MPMIKEQKTNDGRLHPQEHGWRSLGSLSAELLALAAERRRPVEAPRPAPLVWAAE